MAHRIRRQGPASRSPSEPVGRSSGNMPSSLLDQGRGARQCQFSGAFPLLHAVRREWLRFPGRSTGVHMSGGSRRTARSVLAFDLGPVDDMNDILGFIVAGVDIGFSVQSGPVLRQRVPASDVLAGNGP